MQTFLPNEDFLVSAAMLDTRRLNNQRNECLVLMKAITGRSNGWRDHPVTRMWAPWLNALGSYAVAISLECDARGIADNTYMFLRFTELMDPAAEVVMPDWLGDERLHASHRAALLAKNPSYYSRFNWEEDAGIDYWWPAQSRIALPDPVG